VDVPRYSRVRRLKERVASFLKRGDGRLWRLVPRRAPAILLLAAIFCASALAAFWWNSHTLTLFPSGSRDGEETKEVKAPEEPGAEEAPVPVTEPGPALPAPEPQEAAPPPANVEEARMVAPIAAEVSVTYGWNYSQTHEDWRFHPGLDYAAPEGSPVRAAASGLVARVSEDRQWGGQVVLTHDGGLETRYMGLGAIKVEEGQQVKAGEVLGEVGAPGLAEVGQGPHLHFEVRAQGDSQDPETLFR